MNIIGDIEGNYLTFLALLKKMPDEEVFVLGDFIDRGPRSKDMIEWLIKNGRAFLGNHEHMLVDAYSASKDPLNYKLHYQKDLWLDYNQGETTLRSYSSHYKPGDPIHKIIPEAHVEWIKNLPLYYETDDLFLSHAPLMRRTTPTTASDLEKDKHHKSSLIWNRHFPYPYKNKLQIFGHLSFKEVRYFSESFRQGNRKPPTDKLYAMAIETERGGFLTGIHYPSLTIYQQEYID